MKTVFLLEIPTPYRGPLLEILHRLKEPEIYVLYCAADDPYREWTLESDAFPFEILPGVSLGGRQGGTSWKFNPSVLRRLNHLGPDVVVLGSYAQPSMLLAILWCRLRRVPYILMSESHARSPRKFWRRALKAPWIRFVASRAGACLPSGSEARDYLVSHGAEIDRTFFFPNCSDTEAIGRAVQQRQEKAHSEDASDQIRPSILYVGRLIKIKNVDLLLEAFASAHWTSPRASLTIVGDGPQRSELEALARSLDLTHVSFRGIVQPNELVHLYAAADVFVLPSQTESWGVVVLEALAAGVPVVVSDQVGCSRDVVVEGRNGRIVPVGDCDSLAQALVEVAALANEPDARALARQKAIEWSYDLCISSFTSAIDAAIASR